MKLTIILITEAPLLYEVEANLLLISLGVEAPEFRAAEFSKASAANIDCCWSITNCFSSSQSSCTYVKKYEEYESISLNVTISLLSKML